MEHTPPILGEGPGLFAIDWFAADGAPFAPLSGVVTPDGDEHNLYVAHDGQYWWRVGPRSEPSHGWHGPYPDLDAAFIWCEVPLP